MKINKFIIVLLAALVIVSMSGIGSAAITTNTVNSPTTTTQTATVSYGASQGYTITLPSEVAFTSSDLTMTTTINATNVVLNEGNALEIQVNSTHGWRMYEHDGETVPADAAWISYSMSFTLNDDSTTYSQTTLTDDGAADEWTRVLIVPTGSEGETTVTFAMEAVPQTGDYKDTLSFTINPSATVA